MTLPEQEPPAPKQLARVMFTVRVPAELAWRFRAQTFTWRLTQNDVLCSLIAAFVEDREAAAAQGADSAQSV